MFGWFKRNDGFEWHDYVRTTILLRRRKRRERLAKAGHAAVQGMKDAGRRGAAAGVESVQGFGRGAVAVGRQGAALGVAGVNAAQKKVRVGLPIAGAWMRAVGRGLRSSLARSWSWLGAIGRDFGRGIVWLWAHVRAGSIRFGQMLSVALAAGATHLEPVFAALCQPHIRAPLAIVGFAAVFGASARLAVMGFDLEVAFAALIGLVILGALFVARPLNNIGWPGNELRNKPHDLLAFGPKATSAVVVIFALVLFGGAGWLLWRNAPALLTLTGPITASAKIEGRGIAVSGDTLRVAGTMLRLDGIEAPVLGQRCRRGKSSRRWNCGASAKAALARLVRRAKVSCEITGSDDNDYQLVDCRVGEKNVARELVRGGHVFATAGYFAPYAGLESEARQEKIGIWRGEAVRPSDYRAQKWEEAKRAAPNGCPIKGNVLGGRRVYVLPWTRGYERVRITRRRGERWFCSETEARAAGWKPAGRS